MLALRVLPPEAIAFRPSQLHPDDAFDDAFAPPEYGECDSFPRCSSFVSQNTRGLGSQLKDSVPVTELSASGPFESHDLLRKGFSCVKNELLPSHPLELSEKNFQLNQDKMNFSTLRNIQGLFAPLKLQMEFKAVQQVQRLPFLPSSNLSLDILRGNDETIGFEDILNDPSQSELMGEPHLMVEYKLGLL
ncbi:proteasome maturation protein [Pteropus alecto]|uniref:proteasome maturation protein n=1 Tax=Pteropus alecto TaxID=9402 RepID=UPI000D532B3D|nr:proteasome maturation protein [Pteropus alecto]